MIEAPQIIGTTLLNESDRVPLGRVADLVCDADRRLIGLLIGKRGLLRRSRVLPIEAITAVNKDGLTADEKKSLVKKSDIRFKDALERPAKVLGIAVEDEAGESLGRSVAVRFGQEHGELIELEVSKGAISSLTGGRRLIEGRQLKSWHADKVIVGPDTPVRSRGGLKSKVSNFGARLGRLRDEADRIISAREARFAAGKRTDREVLGRNGQVIVAAGEIVTDEHIKLAVKEDRLHQLAMAVGAGSAKKSWSHWTEPETTPEQGALESESLNETQGRGD